MTRSIVATVVLGCVALLFYAFGTAPSHQGDTPLVDVLLELGEAPPAHFVQDRTNEMVQKGYELVHHGKLISDFDHRSTYISKYYVCTSCHNTVREDPVITEHDPEARLEYCLENNVPFLQGSTFWGIVNRTSWYNGDYVKKYGDLVVAANKSLRESMQLCATVCSQGRALNGWEMDAMLAYLWSLELKLSDLGLSKEDIYKLNYGKLPDRAKVQWLQTRYPLLSPATFAGPPTDKGAGYGLLGDPVKGEAIYLMSCQHCHHVEGESAVVLEDNSITRSWLLRNRTARGQRSFYEAIRYGTYPIAGHAPYMPLYPLERMNDQQVEDLRAYLEQGD